ncbi:hypothetical protein AB0C12_43185 [Actinoplanes sp. NPDC048967]|uniref:hypothetical protein n=1 Tax=Actinoplanes sp. NPDC048967 TaxID=3155269 RepID=UPI0033D48E6F
MDERLEECLAGVVSLVGENSPNLGADGGQVDGGERHWCRVDGEFEFGFAGA